MTQNTSVTPLHDSTIIPLHQESLAKQSKYKIFAKILLSYFPFYTMLLFILYMSMYYTVPPGTILYNNLKLETQLMTQNHKDPSVKLV
jgi:hypothetical protein